MLREATMRGRIGIREVRALQPGTVLWDTQVRGFGARRVESDAVIFVLKYRTKAGRQRWHRIGRFNSPWTPDEARDEARRLLGDVARGADPGAGRTQHGAITVAQLCSTYIADAKAGRLMKTASTIGTDESRIGKHVIPLLGPLSVSAVTRDDIENFMHKAAAKGGKGTATRTTNLLSAIFSYAIAKGVRPDNPCKGIKRFAEGKRDRRFSDDEYKRLGIALRKAQDEQIWPSAMDAVRFIALTGWRAGEAVALRWSDIDIDRRTAVLSDTKTGRSMRPLSQAACDVLGGIPRTKDVVFVPPPRSSDGQWFKTRVKRNIFPLGGLPGDLGMHVLRHSFASLAADLGYSEPTIASLLGHKGRSITSRYIHSADAVLLAAADAVAGRIVGLMS
jgi:integrase